MPTPLTHTTIHQIKIIGLFLLTAILLIPALSVLSPLYGMPPGSDVQFYGVIGRGIFDGFIPYRDLCDHKGPLIFFIYGGLQQLSYSFTPILIFEILCLTTTLYFAYKTALLFCNEKIAIISAILVAFFLCSSAYFEGGGNPSEFILTFQFITLFITAKEWVNKTTQSWLIIGIITSFCCSFAFFLKFNICSFWIIPFLFLIYRSKQKNNLFQFILGGVLGLSLLALPILLYLVLNNSLSFFIESYFLYSTHYGLSGSTMSYITNYSSIIKKMFLTFNGCYLCICLYVITISKLKPLLKLAIISSFIITFLRYSEQEGPHDIIASSLSFLIISWEHYLFLA
ncbi:MAG: glycosyltransferase family 39 protein [Akkermansia sp.]